MALREIGHSSYSSLGIAITAGLLLLLPPGCGGGGGSGPTPPTCVDQGVAVAVRIEPPGASNCSVGNTPFVQVTNSTCSTLTVTTIDETLTGLSGPCAGQSVEFSNSINDTLAQGESTEYELPPWEWCFPGGSGFNCQLREDVVVETDGGSFAATGQPFRVFFNSQCVSCEEISGSQSAGAVLIPSIEDGSPPWIP